MQQENIWKFRLVSNYQLNAQFLYSITIYTLHYNPRLDLFCANHFLTKGAF